MLNRPSEKCAILAASRFAPAALGINSRSLCRTTVSASAPKLSSESSIPFTLPSVPVAEPAWGSVSACPSFANMAETSRPKRFRPAARRSPSICQLHPVILLGLPLLLWIRELPQRRFVQRLTFSKVARCSFSTTKRVSGCFFKKAYQPRAYEWTAPRPRRRPSHTLGAPAMTCFSAICTFPPAATPWMAARLLAASSKLPENKTVVGLHDRRSARKHSRSCRRQRADLPPKALPHL